MILKLAHITGFKAELDPEHVAALLAHIGEREFLAKLWAKTPPDPHYSEGDDA